MRDHPTVQRFHEMQAQRTHLPENPRVLDADWLRQLCLDCGADDVGFVELDRPALADQRAGGRVAQRTHRQGGRADGGKHQETRAGDPARRPRFRVRC